MDRGFHYVEETFQTVQNVDSDEKLQMADSLNLSLFISVEVTGLECSESDS